MDTTQMIIVVGLLITLIGFLVCGSYLNKKTELPDGFEMDILGCSSCSHSGCSMAKGSSNDLIEEIKTNEFNSEEKVD